MTTAYTSLLGFALPVTGELSGTWGDTVNNGITSLLDSAIAGTTTLSADSDVTLTTTQGSSNTAREAILLWTAGGSATRTITAPAQSKIYTVINASSGTQSIILAGAGPTSGVTIAKGESALCAWNGSDFIKISNTAGPGTFTNLTVTGNTSLGDADTDTITQAASYVTGTQLKSAKTATNTLSLAAYDVDGTAYTNLITLTASNTPTLALTSTGVGTINNMSIGATTASTGAFTTLSASSTVTLSGGTENGVAYLNGSKVLTTGSALTFDGTVVNNTGAAPNFRSTITGGSYYTNLAADGIYAVGTDLYLLAPSGKFISFYANNSEKMRLGAATGGVGALGIGYTSLTSVGDNGLAVLGNVGIGTASPSSKLEIVGVNPKLTINANDSVNGRNATLSLISGTSADPSGTCQIMYGASNSTTAGTLTFVEGDGTERMRITLNGDVGIGGTPANTAGYTTLTLNNTTNGGFLALSTGGVQKGGLFNAGNNVYLDCNNAVGNLYIRNTSTGATAQIDPNGNLGLKIAANAWGTGYSAINLFSANSLGLGGSDYGAQLTCNTYSAAGGWTRVGASYGAGRYEQFNGYHAWYGDAAGAAGVYTPTQRMTLLNDGSFTLQTTNNSASVGVGYKWFYNASNPYVAVVVTDSTSGSNNYHLYSTNAAAFRFYVGLDGRVNATQTTIAAISDERLKENIRDLDVGLTDILALKPRRFDWKEGKGANIKNAAGFVAQEFEQVFPKSVNTSLAGADGIEYKNVCHDELIPTMVKAIQEQQALITQLTARITALEGA